MFSTLLKSSSRRFYHHLRPTTLSYDPGLGIAPVFSPRQSRELYDGVLGDLMNQLELLKQDSEYSSTSSLTELLNQASGLKSPQDARLLVLGSQVWNMEFFFHGIRPNPPAALPHDLEQRVVNQFGSVEQLKQLMLNHALALFGPGWVWCCEHPQRHSLHVMVTMLSGTPWLAQPSELLKSHTNTTNGQVEGTEEGRGGGGGKKGKMRPLLGVSVWEHMYITEYGWNGRRQYLEQWWQAINWQQVAHRLSLTGM